MARAACLALIALLCWGHRPAAGVEVVSIPSRDGRLQLSGHWFEAVGTGPRPAVVSLHGCGGLLDDRGRPGRNRLRVAEYFNVERIHVLLLDSFTPRGVKSICETPVSRRSIQYEDRRDDAFAAIRWLAGRPGVDASRIGVIGYSHGGGTVLSVLDRTESAVRGQPFQPRAAVAFYPPCSRYVRMWRYEIGAPLLLMIGELDDWTPAHHCVSLHARVTRAQPDPSFELIVHPGSHHGFDGYGPVTLRRGLPTRTGAATVGANPEARDRALRRTFEFLSAHLGAPLRLSHDERFTGHRYAVPAPSGFAAIDDVGAVPLDDAGRERYRHYLARSAPRAFAISERGGAFLAADDTEAMKTALAACGAARARCWLYAVDDRVVWSGDAEARIDAGKLRRATP